MTELHKILSSLPPDLREEVEDFVAFLVERRAPRFRAPMRLDWTGALPSQGRGALEFKHRRLGQ